MILLDTTIITEAFRRRPNPNVREWLDSQRSGDLFLCMPVLAGLHYGVELLSPGARRVHLELAVRKIEETFADRILLFDRVAAREYGKILALRDNLGRSTGTMEGFVAAIAKVHSAVIATRNSRGFDGVGLEIIDPFDPSTLK
jgi:predicted nucleic acid-binding protein